MTDTFSQTSDVLYDRHHYEIRLKTGKTVFFDDWSAAQQYWWAHCQIPDYLDVIKVLDKNKRKEKVKVKGFGT